MCASGLTTVPRHYFYWMTQCASLKKTDGEIILLYVEVAVSDFVVGFVVEV